MSDLHERVAVVETEVKTLTEMRKDILHRLARLEYLVWGAIGSGLLAPLLRGCL